MIDRLLKEWTSIPEPARAQIQSFVVSAGWGALTATGTLYGAYQVIPGHGNLWAFVTNFLFTPASIGSITATAAAYYRAAQAKKRIENTVTLPDGRRAIIVSGSGSEAPPTPTT
jgi:hypothetical protein